MRPKASTAKTNKRRSKSADTTESRPRRGPGRPSAGAHPEQTYPPTARVIKRYGNRRLYDAAQSRCVTMTEIEQMVRDGEDVRVVDGDTGEDISKRVLVQIILEQQNADQLELLPVALLHQIISMRSQATAGWLGQYLQAGAEFLERQAKAAGPAWKAMNESMTTLFPWLNPEAAGRAQPPRPPEPPAAASTPPSESTLRNELDELQRRFAELSARIGRG